MTEERVFSDRRLAYVKVMTQLALQEMERQLHDRSVKNSEWTPGDYFNLGRRDAFADVLDSLVTHKNLSAEEIFRRLRVRGRRRIEFYKTKDPGSAATRGTAEAVELVFGWMDEEPELVRS